MLKKVRWKRSNKIISGQRLLKGKSKNRIEQNVGEKVLGFFSDTKTNLMMENFFAVEIVGAGESCVWKLGSVFSEREQVK